MRRALSDCLRSWPLLRIDLVGSSVLENVTDINLRDRIVATMSVMGIDAVKDFDVLEAAVSRRQNRESSTMRRSRLWRRSSTRLRKMKPEARTNLHSLGLTGNSNK